MIQFRLKTKIFFIKIFSFSSEKFFNFLVFSFSVANKILNKKKVLVYTDSRGFEITKPWNRKNPFSSYVKFFILNYDCSVVICPYRFTSLLDFVAFYKKKNKKYDYVILHCGIVDFAPRPKSSYEDMLKTKEGVVEDYNLQSFFDKSKLDSTVLYEGEGTLSFLDSDLITGFLLEELIKIEELIYISINPVINNWRGSYWRDRPKNINDQLALDELIIERVPNVINLSSLTNSEIKLFTSDNVHYTKAGFDFIESELKRIIDR